MLHINYLDMEQVAFYVSHHCKVHYIVAWEKINLKLNSLKWHKIQCYIILTVLSLWHSGDLIFISDLIQHRGSFCHTDCFWKQSCMQW